MGRWLKIGHKRAIVRMAKATPSMSQGELPAWVAKQYKLRNKPARNAISDILKNAAKIMSAAYGDDNQRKPTQVTSPQLEKRLAAWIMDLESRNICLSRELITMKAQELQPQVCDAWDLNFSDGWLTAFMRRHKLRHRIRHGEAASADPEAVRIGLQQIQQVTDMYAPQDIYNMDETGLCYAMAPTRSICTNKMRGVKKKKTRLTLVMTANADGSNALPILYLGHAKKPRCFNKKSAKSLGFNYKANTKAWMTRVIFQEWLRGVDLEMRAAGRHILLLLDNASSHDVGDLALTNVTVQHLPPNTTACIQPMDAGIIASFKAAYKKRQIRYVYNKLREPGSIKKDPYAIDQLQAMKWSDEIWREVTKKDTIKNCFRHTGVCFLGPKDKPDDMTSSSYGDDVQVDEVILRLSSMAI
ncbi:hypothetical protein PR003_g6223 [Phytophthora rubi]|uniref:HTH CENPB-type domain-containing protein n=1 Tax=Phytophthora rubi TaxID=129364 RepID=A0A6A3NHU6_9STRA|nr:hypothetical protein PR002_g4121 [Phytophthora rubi]KAE9043093.1 hypothetical protein PR001_g5925 [Phytophthora rubi]KAE9348770.1 hypothetical protein PR003_g6223 [Phytophthora rubi]